MGRNLQSGKMQYNVATAKDFRAKLAKWHNADFELAVAIDKRADAIANKKAAIADHESSIEKMKNGTMLSSGMTIEERLAAIESIKGEIKSENDTVAELRKAQETRYADAHALLTADLHKAYVAYIKEGKREEYVEELCKFFESNGLTPASASIDEFVACVGKKKATKNYKLANKKHNDAFTFKPWRDIFLGELCDVMGDALPIDKYIYQTMEERVAIKKAKAEAKKNNK